MHVDNLLIHGLPSSYLEVVSKSNEPTAESSLLNPDSDSHFETNEDTETAFVKFCEDLGVDIKPTDIVACHHLLKSCKANKAPLLDRFQNMKIRAQILGTRRQLGETKRDVYINEHFTTVASEIFAITHRLQKEKRLLQTLTLKWEDEVA